MNNGQKYKDTASCGKSILNQGSFVEYVKEKKYRVKAAKIIQNWWKKLKIINLDRLKKIILIQSVYRGKWIRKKLFDSLYLFYLYVCFCEKIEKVLLSNLRPYVFGKLTKYTSKYLINIIDENNKYPKSNAIDKNLNKEMKCSIILDKKIKLNNLLVKKQIYTKILLRKKLYLWYRQIVISKYSFSNDDKLKVYEMKQKIFCLIFIFSMKLIYRKTKRIFIRKLYSSNKPKLSDKKYKSIYDLIHYKLNNNSDFKDGIEKTYNINDKIVTVIKQDNELLIIDEDGNKSRLNNYKEIIKKKKYHLEKKDSLINKNEKESGNEPYETAEDQNVNFINNKKVIKMKRKKNE